MAIDNATATVSCTCHKGNKHSTYNGVYHRILEPVYEQVNQYIHSALLRWGIDIAVDGATAYIRSVYRVILRCVRHQQRLLRNGTEMLHPGNAVFTRKRILLVISIDAMSVQYRGRAKPNVVASNFQSVLIAWHIGGAQHNGKATGFHLVQHA